GGSVIVVVLLAIAFAGPFGIPQVAVRFTWRWTSFCAAVILVVTLRMLDLVVRIGQDLQSVPPAAPGTTVTTDPTRPPPQARSRRTIGAPACPWSNRDGGRP